MNRRATLTLADLFAVPLADGGWGIGVIGAVNKSIVLGYFFDIVCGDSPQHFPESDVWGEDVILVSRFSYVSLRDGLWPVVGRFDSFQSIDWPALEFSIEPSVASFGQVAQYSSSLRRIGELHVIPSDDVGQFPSNDVFDTLGIERELSKLLHRKQKPISSDRDIRWRFTSGRYEKQPPLTSDRPLIS